MILDRLRVPPPPQISPFLAYACAVVIPLVTLAIQHALLPLVHLVPFILFFLAVFLVSWMGGRGPGFVATGISAIAADYHFIPPFDAFSFEPRALLLIGLFCLVSTIVNVLSAGAVEAFAEAQQAIRARDDFLSVAGHELKTPLTTLRLHLDALTQHKGAPSDPLSGKHAERAQRSLDRLLQLIDELLDVARIRAGRLELRRKSCDLSEIALSVADQLRDAAARAGSELRTLAPNAARGEWDRSRIEQVVTNLVGNAIKFGSGKPVELRVTLASTVARLEVEDHGVGIAPEDQSRIFGRFEQATSAQKRAGLGLGLWIAKRVVDAHGGSVRVRSVPGQGATFTVELPVAKASDRRSLRPYA